MSVKWGEETTVRFVEIYGKQEFCGIYLIPSIEANKQEKLSCRKFWTKWECLHLEQERQTENNAI
jgi:hypothetical protein